MSIILTGMPGAGKSTIGPLLSKRLGSDFIDTDSVIKDKTGRELADIVKASGYEEFLRVQEEILLSLSLTNHVAATGGSVVLSPKVMSHLKSMGRVVYLKLDYAVIEQRLAPGRRLARDRGRTLKDLFDERTVLYEKYADIVIDCNTKNVDEILSEIEKKL